MSPIDVIKNVLLLICTATLFGLTLLSTRHCISNLLPEIQEHLRLKNNNQMLLTAIQPTLVASNQFVNFIFNEDFKIHAIGTFYIYETNQ